MDDVHAAHGPGHALAIEDTALNVLDIGGPRGIVPDVEDPDLGAARAQAPRDQVPDESGAAGDKVPQRCSTR
jgi:hypothetical protein